MAQGEVITRPAHARVRYTAFWTPGSKAAHAIRKRDSDPPGQALPAAVVRGPRSGIRQYSWSAFHRACLAPRARRYLLSKADRISAHAFADTFGPRDRCDQGKTSG